MKFTSLLLVATLSQSAIAANQLNFFKPGEKQVNRSHSETDALPSLDIKPADNFNSFFQSIITFNDELTKTSAALEKKQGKLSKYLEKNLAVLSINKDKKRAEKAQKKNELTKIKRLLKLVESLKNTGNLIQTKINEYNKHQQDLLEILLPYIRYELDWSRPPNELSPQSSNQIYLHEARNQEVPEYKTLEIIRRYIERITELEPFMAAVNNLFLNNKTLNSQEISKEAFDEIQSILNSSLIQWQTYLRFHELFINEGHKEQAKDFGLKNVEHIKKKEQLKVLNDLLNCKPQLDLLEILELSKTIKSDDSLKLFYQNQKSGHKTSDDILKSLEQHRMTLLNKAVFLPVSHLFGILQQKFPDKKDRRLLKAIKRIENVSAGNALKDLCAAEINHLPEKLKNSLLRTTPYIKTTQLLQYYKRWLQALNVDQLQKTILISRLLRLNIARNIRHNNDGELKKIFLILDWASQQNESDLKAFISRRIKTSDLAKVNIHRLQVILHEASIISTFELNSYEQISNSHQSTAVIENLNYLRSNKSLKQNAISLNTIAAINDNYTAKFYNLLFENCHEMLSVKRIQDFSKLTPRIQRSILDLLGSAVNLGLEITNVHFKTLFALKISNIALISECMHKAIQFKAWHHILPQINLIHSTQIAQTFKMIVEKHPHYAKDFQENIALINTLPDHHWIISLIVNANKSCIKDSLEQIEGLSKRFEIADKLGLSDTMKSMNIQEWVDYDFGQDKAFSIKQRLKKLGISLAFMPFAEAFDINNPAIMLLLAEKYNLTECKTPKCQSLVQVDCNNSVFCRGCEVGMCIKCEKPGHKGSCQEFAANNFSVAAKNYPGLINQSAKLKNVCFFNSIAKFLSHIAATDSKFKNFLNPELSPLNMEKGESTHRFKLRVKLQQSLFDLIQQILTGIDERNDGLESKSIKVINSLALLMKIDGSANSSFVMGRDHCNAHDVMHHMLSLLGWMDSEFCIRTLHEVSNTLRDYHSKRDEVESFQNVYTSEYTSLQKAIDAVFATEKHPKAIQISDDDSEKIDIEKKATLANHPSILVINVNQMNLYGTGILKKPLSIENKIKIPAKIDGQNYLLHYRKVSSIIHTGTMNFGHYTCITFDYGSSPNKPESIYHNDSSVSTLSNIESEQIESRASLLAYSLEQIECI